MKIGVICPSEIAIRRFMPALQKCEDVSFSGVAVFSKTELLGAKEITDLEFSKILKPEVEKAQFFIDQYGGELFHSYMDIVSSPKIDALYIPLPPALHFKWAKLALESGKHVLVEKPSTTSADDSRQLVRIAKEKGLALHENYMFVFHDQIKAIKEIVNSGEIGDVRLYRISFGFPRRLANDFRYNKLLGGGSLIDAGGYTLKFATELLGTSAKIKYAQSNYINEFDVDIYGSAALVNDEGVTAQVAFGMDNGYKCELEVWGSKGCIRTGRILTAPVGFVPKATIIVGNESKEIDLPADDAFLKSISHFIECIQNENTRNNTYDSIIKQAEIVDNFKDFAGWKQFDLR